jgi:pimeloyl-ACP methyl ester carboxylesterase
MRALSQYWEKDYDRPAHRPHRSWAEQAYPTLHYFGVVERGGHFAAWAEPALFTREIRAAFRSVR